MAQSNNPQPVIFVAHESVQPRKGRGAISNAAGRFEVMRKVDFDDGWETCSEDSPGAKTQCFDDTARSVITRNQSPDIYFDQSVNPYRGCEHGCIYCFARPTHTYLGHSAGLDFERILYAKRDAAKLLKNELAKPGYRCAPIAIGVNTDAYQPLERKLGITRALLQVISDCRHPVFMITKSSLIERDIDLLQDLASDDLVSVSISITTLDKQLARFMEPRAASPARRLRTLEALSKAGIRTRVSVSPVIPALNEHEMETIIGSAANAGAKAASYIPLRLPHELSILFPEWLRQFYPDKADRVINALKDIRGDKLNDAQFGSRMRGFGPRADIIQRRFELACKRAGLASNRRHSDKMLSREWTLRSDKFIRPTLSGEDCGVLPQGRQLNLF